MNISVTMVGIFLTALAYIARQAGVDLKISEADLQTTASTIIAVIGLAIAYFGRVRQGDINWYGRKKIQNTPIDSVDPQP